MGMMPSDIMVNDFDSDLILSNRILKIMGECNPNMEGAKEFIHSLMLNQSIWPNQYGQDVAAAAFFIHEERLKAQQEINRLREEIKKAIIHSWR